MTIRQGDVVPIQQVARSRGGYEPENAFAARVLGAARLLGWVHYHTYYSGRSPAGFPDLVLCRPPRLVFAELKTDSPKSVLTAKQRDWLALLRACPAVETYLWRPADWPEIERLLR